MYDTRFSWTSAALSDVGLVRRINEDACLERPECGLWVVADGMGGHALGHVASGMVVEALQDLATGKTLAETVVTVRRPSRTMATVSTNVLPVSRSCKASTTMPLATWPRA